MATLLTTFAETDLKMRFREPFGTAGLNAKLAINTPPGTYRGFRLGVNGANDTVTLVSDPDALDHVAVYQTQTGFSLTIRTDGGDSTLDLSGLVDAAEKTWVIAIYATYVLSTPTSAEIRAYELDPTDDFTVAVEKGELVVLGTVTIPAGGGVAIPAANITTERRTQAWTSVAKEALPWAPLIRNAGFEWSDDDAGNELVADASLFWERDVVGTDNWITDLANVDSGSRAVSFSYSGAGTPSVEMYQHVHLPVTEGQTIKLKARKKALQVSTGGSAELFVEMADADGAGTTLYAVALDLSGVEGSFSTVEGSVQAPVGSGHNQITRVGVRTNAVSFGGSGLAFTVDSIQAWLEVSAIDDLDIASSAQGILAAHKLTLVDHSDPDQGTTPAAGFLQYDSATNLVSVKDKSGTDIGMSLGESEISLAAGPAWADGTTNPAEDVDVRLDSIVNDLATGSGSAKILTAAGPAWHDATTNPAERLDQRIDSIVSDLVANEGADRIGVAATPSAIITGGISVQDALAALESELEDRRINRRNIYFGKHDQSTSSGTTNSQRFLLTGNADSVNIMVPSMVEGGRINGFAVYGVLSAADHYTARLMKRTSSAAATYALVGALQTSPTASGLHLLAHNLATPADGNIAGALGFIIQIQLLGAGSLSVETLIADIQDDI